MSNQLLDGKSLSKKIRQQLKEKIEKANHHLQPKLAVVLVGQDKASKIYVASKEKACEFVGIASTKVELPKDISQVKLEETIKELAEDPSIHGILLQLPLPDHLNKHNVIEKIPPHKDVDGLTAYSQGLLAKRKPGHRPCTPKGIIRLLEEHNVEIAGKITAVIGRSTLVGAPVTRMLEHRGATTISINRKTPTPKLICNMADILVVAAGSMHLVDESWVKPNAVVIDVGIHRNKDGLCGDVKFDQVKDKASLITPVPGGVGPMTVAMLLVNCYEAFLMNS